MTVDFSCYDTIENIKRLDEIIKAAKNSATTCSYLCSSPHGRSGQGEVFKAIGEYFAAEKQQAAIWYPVQPLPAYRRQAIRRRTTRSLLEPAKNKGWKGKR